MNKVSIFALLCGLLLLSNSSAAQSSARDLKLLPAPREIRLGHGSFKVGPNTRIVLVAQHVPEDRTAAEMLAQEIADQSGLKIPIEVGASNATAAGSIVMARVNDREVRSLLEAMGARAGAGLDAQGYLLVADGSRIIVAGETGQGVFYGVQTLRQLLRPLEGGLTCPAVSIRDWPSMPWRGLQDDISRGPVPTLDYMKKQIRIMAAYKMNLFALYMEHVFDYQSQPLVAPKEAAVTPAELQDLVAYAQKYYVTVLPEQQTFGHLHHMLKYEVYSSLAERPSGHVLAPGNEKTYQLIDSMYSELAPLVAGPFLHIGSDETFELGRGQSRARVSEIGLGQVYVDHLQRVAEVLRPYHKRLIFWGDIAEDYPELLPKLPKNLVAMPWNYEPRESFDDVLKPFKNAGLDVMVAPGASSWEQIWPNLDVAFVNIRNFVRDGQRYGALGMLNTTWNDDGESLLEMAWPAFVFGGAAAWQPGESSIEDFKSSYDWAFYRNSDDTFHVAIEGLNRAHSLLAGVGLRNANNELFWANPFTEVGAKQLSKAQPIARDLRLSAEQAIELLYRHRNQAHANSDTLDAMLLAAWRLEGLGMKIQFAGDMNRFYWESYGAAENREMVLENFDELTGTNARLEDLRDATTRLRGLYEREWLQEYRPYWLANVLVRYDRMAGIFEGEIQAVRESQAQFQSGEKLPPPQQLGFFLKP